MMCISFAALDGCKSKFNLQDERALFRTIRFIASYLVDDNIEGLISEYIYDYDDVLTRNVLLYFLKVMYNKHSIDPYHEELEKEIMNIDYVEE